MKNLKNLSGVKVLDKKAQKEINGGKKPIFIEIDPDCILRPLSGSCPVGFVVQGNHLCCRCPVGWC